MKPLCARWDGSSSSGGVFPPLLFVVTDGLRPADPLKAIQDHGWPVGVEFAGFKGPFNLHGAHEVGAGALMTGPERAVCGLGWW